MALPGEVSRSDIRGGERLMDLIMDPIENEPLCTRSATPFRPSSGRSYAADIDAIMTLKREPQCGGARA